MPWGRGHMRVDRASASNLSCAQQNPHLASAVQWITFRGETPQWVEMARDQLLLLLTAYAEVWGATFCLVRRQTAMLLLTRCLVPAVM